MTDMLKDALEKVDLVALAPMVETVAFALPVFVFLTLVTIVLRGRRRRAGRRVGVENGPIDTQVAPSIEAPTSIQRDHDMERAVGGSRSEDARASDVAGDTSVRTVGSRSLGLITTAQDAAQSALPVAGVASSDAQITAPTLSIAALNMQIEHAMASASTTSVAPLYLEVARLHKAAGDYSAYLVALRSAAGTAAQFGPRAAHAEARLALAEAAFEAGDLTGACEQWQMARVALQEDGQKAAYAQTDKRMRDNGCPTDWVLTDF